MVELEQKMTEERLAKEAERRRAYRAKFTKFDHEYEAKHDWYQKNIIDPQIHKHMEDLDREQVYNKAYYAK